MRDTAIEDIVRRLPPPLGIPRDSAFADFIDYAKELNLMT